AALEDDDQLVPGVHDPVLELDQLALQPEQLLEIVHAACAVADCFRRAARKLASLLDVGRHAVVELHLQLLVEAVERVLVDPAEGCVVACGVFGAHGSSLVSWMIYRPPTGRVSTGPGPVLPVSSSRASSISREKVALVSWSVRSI